MNISNLEVLYLRNQFLKNSARFKIIKYYRLLSGSMYFSSSINFINSSSLIFAKHTFRLAIICFLDLVVSMQ